MAIEPAPEQSENLDDNVVAIWSKAVDTQMHFNEMSVKSRQLGLTFVATALALAVFLFSHSGTDAKSYHPAKAQLHPSRRGIYYIGGRCGGVCRETTGSWRLS